MRETGRRAAGRGLGALGIVGLALALTLGCSGQEASPQATTPAPAAAASVEAPADTTPRPSLLIVQAQFEKVDGRPTPRPAKLLLLRSVEGGTWTREEIEDPDANVFHKALAWRGGILTIGAATAPGPATLKHWTRGSAGWSATTLWSRAWDGARFNRLRDLEIGDVDGDGADELVIATHDRGVVAVGDEEGAATPGAPGTWTFTELDEAPDTFVHEIEIGDVDGDGRLEFYATPSARNKASGASQPGSVVRYDKVDGAWVRSTVVDYDDSHAKEILVTDVDGDGRDELYVVREAHVVTEDGVKQRLDPVRIVRFDKGEAGWSGTTVATLDDDQTRFLVPGDVDGDGQVELVAAGFKSGLWRLERQEDGSFSTSSIAADSSGFEHATHVADLDGDGKVEIYVASDDQKELRSYRWDGASFVATRLGAIGPASRTFITWNVQDGVF